MGVFTRFSQLFKRPRAQSPTVISWARTPGSAAPTLADAFGEVRPSEPVRIDLSIEDGPDEDPTLDELKPEPDDEPSLDPSALRDEAPPADAPAAPAKRFPSLVTNKGRQELITELRQDYAEVIDLVRKVNVHLDAQERRSERLLEIAERVGAAAETLPRVLPELLPQIRQQGEQQAEAIRELAAAARAGRQDLDAGLRGQAEAIGRVGSLLAESGQTERQIADALSDLGRTVGGVASGTEALGRVIQSLHEREAERGRELAQAIGRQQRWLVGGLVLCALCALAAVVVAAIALG